MEWHAVLFVNSGSVIPNIIATSSTVAMQRSTRRISISPSLTQSPAVNSVNARTGVFALGGFSSSGSDSINLGTLYGGGWYLGGDLNNVSFFGSITPGVDANHVPTYRLGGGDGSLFVGNPKVVQQGTTVTNVVIGATLVGGTGIVHYGAVMTTTGTTTINTGSTLDIDFPTTGTLTNLMNVNSTLVLNGGTFTVTGNAASPTLRRSMV